MAPAGGRQGRGRVQKATQYKAKSSAQRRSDRGSRGSGRGRAGGHNSQPKEGADRLSCLPTELLFMIMGDPGHSKRLSKVAVSLCRVSKKFNDLITPIMYRRFSTFDITGQDNEAIVKPFLFLRTIISRPDLSYQVKSIALKWEWNNIRRPIMKPDPNMLWEVYVLAGIPDCQLRIPWGVASTTASGLTELFLFALMQILLRTVELEKLAICTPGHVYEGTYSSDAKILARTDLCASLPKLRQVSCADDSMLLPFICSWAPNLQELDLTSVRLERRTELGNLRLRHLRLRNLRRLDLNSMSINNRSLRELLLLCGPLLSFKYEPKTEALSDEAFLFKMQHFTFQLEEEPRTTVPGILDALAAHKSTLEELTVHMGFSLSQSNNLSSLTLNLTGFEKLKMLGLDTSSFEPVGWLTDMLPRGIESFCLLRRISWFLDVSTHAVKSMRDQLLRFTERHSEFPLLKKVSFGSRQGATHHGVSGIEDDFRGIGVEYTSFEVAE